ncbi:hypothetical protein OQA88_10736 [Cercophora sp. LCS_1]
MRISSSSVIIAVAAVPWAAAQLVTGIKAGVNEQTGERPARLNINDLHREAGPAWDLFIQALQAVYDTPEDDLLSWFQIAGIHGLPFKPWNNVGQVEGGVDKAGYCPHGETTFITWHRPYQTIHTHAQSIAATYTGSAAATYKSAAETLRFPFWDWAADSQLPPVVTQPTITINAPAGPTAISNPLYSYKFATHPFTDPDFLENASLAQFSETKRCADAAEGSDGVNHYEIISDTLGSAGNIVRDQVYTVFSKTTKFEDMASEDGAGNADFEIPHNTIHQRAGGHEMLHSKVGHIQPVQWSGFDPIFWLHHANVDRQFAMWQAIYHNNAMFTSTVRGKAVFGTPAGSVTADSPLKPFQYEKDQFWTSKRAETTRVFGYTYPGLNDWAVTKEELAKQVTAMVNTLYGPKTTSLRVRQVTRTKDYAVEISVERKDLALPCAIEVLVGDTLAGEFALLEMPTEGVASANIPLQRALDTEKVSLGRTAEEVVGDIKGKLRLVVRTSDSETPAKPSTVKSLKVEIEDRDYTPAKSLEEFPTYGEKTTWPVDIKELDD